MVAAREPPHRHLQGGGRGSGLRAELRSAAPHATRPRVGLAARRAGTRLPPSGPRRHPRRRRRRRGRSRGDRLRSLALGRLPGEPARAHPSRAGAAARARAHLQPPSEARAPPTPNRKRAPAPAAPTNPYTPCAACGRATFSKIPPTAARLVSRYEGGAGSPEAMGLCDRAGELESACTGCGVSAPGRPAGSASAPEDERGGWASCARAGTRAWLPGSRLELAPGWGMERAVGFVAQAPWGGWFPPRSSR